MESIELPGKSAKEIYQRIKDTFNEQNPLSDVRKADVDFQDEWHRIKVKGEGFEGILQAEDGELRYELDLSFFLRPFRGAVEKKLEDYAKKICLS
jgi:hypothetical protein